MSSSDTTNAYFAEEDRAHELTSTEDPALHFSDSDEGSGDDEHEHSGDYSTRMDELFEDGEDVLEAGNNEEDEDEDEDEDEGFLYTGVDAPEVSVGYRDQLRDVLGTDLDEDEEQEQIDVNNSFLSESEHKLDLDEDEPLTHTDVLSDHTPVSSVGLMTPPSRIESPSLNGPRMKLAQPFLHPTVSRLRSYTPQASRSPSNLSGATSHSQLFDGVSPSPSHFSSLSRVSSTSNIHSPTAPKDPAASGQEREIFKWTELQTITHDIFVKKQSKAAVLLGSKNWGAPTVLAANGLICIGTNEGKICVYDFKQMFKHILGGDSSAMLGAVTALSLSHDHTFVVSGHSTGHIQLFDLKHPDTPARSIPPTSIAVVASGRKEGHLQGSRIVSIGFIAGRHTAIVSADEHGLAFFHSLAKVLFVEASDILRILGKYPVDDTPTTPRDVGSLDKLVVRRRKPRYTVLSMTPLPLGTSPHPTDAYHVIALLTPTKLVVVGLKPTPKTWFKCPRELDEGGSWKSKSKWRGTMAWFPSVQLSSTSKTETIVVTNKNSKDVNGTPTTPLLAYTWGNVLRLIRITESRVKQTIRSSKTGKANEIEVGTIVYETAGKWTAKDDILSIQWLNANQIILVTATMLGVYEVDQSKLIDQIPFDGLTLASPTLSSTVNGAVSYNDAVTDIAHSVRVYKGKIFLLRRDRVEVGTLLTWADRILSFVQAGDFLSAIDLTRSYYLNMAPGNRNGLPDDPQLCKEVIGRKMHELMFASSRYAFSEERMTDGTHITPDGRGVDRTSLFEGLVTTCCRACVALNDFEFLFEDLFQQYDDSGILSIYLRQLEPFMLNNEIREVPPRITQCLIALHDENDRPDHAERLIWHIDPACLDINQAIQLCEKHHLYDALIYVYTRALRDYVAPVVKLLGLIRRVQLYRKSQIEAAEYSAMSLHTDSSMEPVILNAYKIYPYLANVLSGLTYPSEIPLSEEEAFQAKKDVYTFLFFGRSSVWPPGEGGKLILTSDEEGGVEPTYPYARQLLLFDSEAFLHSLDIAFEDSYLNDAQSINRLVVVRILLEIVSSGDLGAEDVTFVNIFVARNVPKYPQFLQIAPSTLHSILIGLAEDPDPNTREDRQLAAEYLLSVYNPHESERIIELFGAAKFYRILRSWHRHDHRWTSLLSTYFDDIELRSSELVEKVDEVLTISSRTNQGAIPTELVTTLFQFLSHLLKANVASTASLLDKHAPSLHEQALEAFGDGVEADQGRFAYLRHLLGPPQAEQEEYNMPSRHSGPALHLSAHLRQLFIDLQCRYRPYEVIQVLKYLPADTLEWSGVLKACESNRVYDAVIWAINFQGDAQGALERANLFQKRLSLEIVDQLDSLANSEGSYNINQQLNLMEAIGRIGIAICLERSRGNSATEVPLEDIWFKLLSAEINSIQVIAGCKSPESTEPVCKAMDSTLVTLRSLVHASLSALVSITSTRAVSFPRLFKRLVNCAPTSTGTHYTEFRTILTGMLESYRSEGDMLVMTKHLIDRDLYDGFADIVRERVKGWAPTRGLCTRCRKPLLERDATSKLLPDSQIIVSRIGTIYHTACLPSES